VRADPGSHGDGVPAGDPLDVDAVGALPHRQLHVLVCRLVQVLHEWQGDVTQTGAARAQRRQLDHPQPDPVLAVRAALQPAPPDQFTDEPVGRRQRQPRPPG
jgi:hypothetical protein